MAAAVRVAASLPPVPVPPKTDLFTWRAATLLALTHTGASAPTSRASASKPTRPCAPAHSRALQPVPTPCTHAQVSGVVLC